MRLLVWPPRTMTIQGSSHILPQSLHPATPLQGRPPTLVHPRTRHTSTCTTYRRRCLSIAGCMGRGQTVRPLLKDPRPHLTLCCRPVHLSLLSLCTSAVFAPLSALSLCTFSLCSPRDHPSSCVPSLLPSISHRHRLSSLTAPNALRPARLPTPRSPPPRRGLR